MEYQPGSSRENFMEWAQNPEALKENVWAFLGDSDRLTAIPEHNQAAFIEGAIDMLDKLKLGCLEVLADFEYIKNFPGAGELRVLAEKRFSEHLNLDKDAIDFILDNFEKLQSTVSDFEVKLSKLIKENISREVALYANKEILKRGLNKNKDFNRVHYAVIETIQSIEEYDRAVKERLDFIKELNLPRVAYHITTKENWKDIQKSGHIKTSDGTFFPGQKVSMSAGLSEQDIDFASRVVMETQQAQEDDLVVIPIDVSKLGLDTTDMLELAGRSEVWSEIDIPLDAVDQSAVIPLKEFKNKFNTKKFA